MLFYRWGPGEGGRLTGRAPSIPARSSGKGRLTAGLPPTSYRSNLAFCLDNPLRQAAGCREEGDQAGLQGVVDIALAGEEAVGGNEVFGQFLVPAAVLVVDESALDDIPDLAIALLMEVARQVIVQEVRGGRRPRRPATRACVRLAGLSSQSSV